MTFSPNCYLQRSKFLSGHFQSIIPTVQLITATRTIHPQSVLIAECLDVNSVRIQVYGNSFLGFIKLIQMDK